MKEKRKVLSVDEILVDHLSCFFTVFPPIVQLLEGEAPLFVAVLENDPFQVQKLVATPDSAFPISATDRYGYTVLHSAASKSDINPQILMVK
jgi:hypothetical protein